MRAKRILSSVMCLEERSGALWERKDRTKSTTLEQFYLWSNEMEKIFVFPFIHSFTRSINGIPSGSLRRPENSTAQSPHIPQERGDLKC